MKSILHKSETRGYANHGWLESWHTFSFADYYDTQRIHFGRLRVLNDDIIQGGEGFGMHPHDNMEIITIPIEGDLEHKDSMGNAGVIRHGDVQVMSAGTGVRHSEYNKNPDIPVKLFQIWVYPNQKNVQPRYEQITLDVSQRHNKLQQIISPNKGEEGIWIYQNAWFHIAKLDKGFNIDYELKDKNNCVYAFVIEGDMQVEGNLLNRRDGLGIWETDKLNIKAISDAEILLIEVPNN